MATEYSALQYRETFPQPELDSAITKGRFSNKVAIVTGGNSGIGRAVVERFSNDGAKVAIFARNKERGEGLASELEAKGGNVKFYQVDVADRERCVEAVKQVADDNGGIVNFLVNNHAAFNGDGIPGIVHDNIADVSMETFKHMLNVNVVGTANMVQACYPYMKNDGNNCAVVNISSTDFSVAHKDNSPYSATKGAINILTKCMALDLSNVGIRVNSVSPGWVWTPIVSKFMKNREVADEYLAKPVHMSRRMIDAAGVASAVVFLCSKDAMYIDGADLPVDSGYTAMGPEGLDPQPELDSAITKGRFSGKVAIVTGGNSRIGRAVVERFKQVPEN